MSVYMQSTFDLEPGAVERFEDSMSRFVPALCEGGWRLVAALRAVTGDVRQVTHVWELADMEAVSAVPAKVLEQQPELLADVAGLTEIIRAERNDFLAPLASNPGRAAAGDGIHLLATFELEFGTMPGFEEALESLVPALGGQGWSLVGTYRASTADLSTAYNLWRLPDAGSLLSAGPAAVAADPGLLDAIASLGPIVRRERIELLVPLAHHGSSGSM